MGCMIWLPGLAIPGSVSIRVKPRVGLRVILVMLYISSNVGDERRESTLVNIRGLPSLSPTGYP
eukprot:scaffold12451_cov73-Cylindrotheca_fusiformis.AAC.1